MDSGSAVPTLNSGLRDTVAAKLLTVANVRWTAVGGAALPGSGRGGVDCAAFMLLRSARFLADERAGRSSPARTAMTAMTTISSMSVKARGRIFIGHLGSCDERLEA